MLYTTKSGVVALAKSADSPPPTTVNPLPVISTEPVNTCVTSAGSEPVPNILLPVSVAEIFSKKL